MLSEANEWIRSALYFAPGDLLVDGFRERHFPILNFTFLEFTGRGDFEMKGRCFVQFHFLKKGFMAYVLALDIYFFPKNLEYILRLCGLRDKKGVWNAQL